MPTTEQLRERAVTLTRQQLLKLIDLVEAQRAVIDRMEYSSDGYIKRYPSEDITQSAELAFLEWEKS